MQTVSSNFLTALKSSNTEEKKQVLVVEFYAGDATPTENGFDPAGEDLLLAVAEVAGVTFRGVTYQRLADNIGDIDRIVGKQLSTFSVKLNNEDYLAGSAIRIYDFEQSVGFEGLICVVRLLDRGVSEDLEDSAIQFTGNCERPSGFEGGTTEIKAKQTVNGTEIILPRRKMTTDDAEGRLPSDPLFEGFRYTQRSGAATYTEKKRVFFIFSKKVQRTMQWSSHSDIDADQPVRLAFGRVQLEAIHIAHEDSGTGIAGTALFCEGEIAAYWNLRSVTPGLTKLTTALKYGKIGGTVDDATHQANDDPGWIGSGVYSKSAYLRYYAEGSRVDTEDPAPTIVSIIFALIVPVPDGSGNFTIIDWTDNPIYLARWLLTSSDVFNLDPNWIDDSELKIEGDYCDHFLVDQSNTDLVQLPENQTDFAGSAYRIYQSTGAVSPLYFKKLAGQASTTDAFALEADYQFYDGTPLNGDDWDGDGIPDFTTPPTSYRRRYTCNGVLNEEVKAHEFLFDNILTTCNGYLVQKANGKIAARVAKPVDFGFVHTANTIGDDEILIKNINPFVGNTNARILIGANLPTSEVRLITGTRYNTSVSISITASGGISSSSATLTGGSSSVAPNATLTVSSASGTKTVTIDGFVLTYAPNSDNLASVAGMIAAQINSHNELNKYIKAVHVPGAATVAVSSRIGYLDLDADLENVHNAKIANPTTAPTGTATTGNLAAGVYGLCYSYETIEGETLTSAVDLTTVSEGGGVSVSAITPPARVLRVNWYFSAEPSGIRRKLVNTNNGAAFVITTAPRIDDGEEPVTNSTAAECHRVAMAFSDRTSTAANLLKSNTLKGTFKLLLGGEQTSINRVDVEYREASEDFQKTTLRINDKKKQQKVRRKNPKTINGAFIDNFNQAYRIGNQKFNEWVDGDRFGGLSSDGEALLLEEGDVICVTDASVRMVNEPLRIEKLKISNGKGYPSISFTARKYRRKYFDDQVRERLVPLPVVINNQPNTEHLAPSIYIISATNAEIVVGVTSFSTQPAFRKVEWSSDADFGTPANIQIKIEASSSEPGFILKDRTSVTRTTNLTNPETVYIRVSHSSNGIEYGAASEIKAATFPDNTETGGSVPEEIPPPPTETGTGSSPPAVPVTPTCPALDQFVLALSESGETFAKEVRYVKVGDRLLNPITHEFERVKVAKVFAKQPVFEVVCKNGATSKASESHPLIQSLIDTNGTAIKRQFAGNNVLTWIDGRLEQSEIVSIWRLAKESVMRIETEGETHIYASGDSEGAMIVCHNLKPLEPIN